MAAPSVTHTFTNGTTADATQMNTNFDDIIQSLTDGTSDLTFNQLTANGAATFNDAVTLGNATGDDITVTGRIASHVDPKTAGTYDLGDATQLWRAVYSNDLFADQGAVGTPSHSFHADTDSGMWGPAANTLAWSVGGTEAARITSARYLGIGTTAPQGWLDVRGTGEATGTIGAVFVTSDNSGSEYATNDLIGKIVFGGNADSATEFEAAGIFAYASGGWSSDSDTPSGLQFHTIPDSSNTLTERMRLDGAGQLGIGTTGPQARLHVEGTGEADGTIGHMMISSDNTSASYATNDLMAKLTFGGRDSDAEEYEAAAIYAFAAGAWPSGSDTPSGLSFYTIADGTNTLAEKMRLGSEGKLAIGTTAAQAWLHIDGTGEATGTIGSIMLSSDNTAASYATNDLISMITFGGRDSDAENYEAASIRAYAAGAWTGNSDTPSGLQFHTVPDNSGTATEKMRLDSEGNLGLGTLGPGNTVDLASGSVRIQSLTSQDPIATDADGDIVAGTSDARLKLNPKAYEPGLDAILRLNPVSYEWDGSMKPKGTHDIGFLAQQVEDVIPEAVGIVNQFDLKDCRTFNSDKLMPAIVNAIKELERRLKLTGF